MGQELVQAVEYSKKKEFLIITYDENVLQIKRRHFQITETSLIFEAVN